MRFKVALADGHVLNSGTALPGILDKGILELDGGLQFHGKKQQITLVGPYTLSLIKPKFKWAFLLLIVGAIMSLIVGLAISGVLSNLEFLLASPAGIGGGIAGGVAAQGEARWLKIEAQNGTFYFFRPRTKLREPRQNRKMMELIARELAPTADA